MEGRDPTDEGRGTVELARLRCVECGARWEQGDARPWRVGIMDDERPLGVVYCAECASREFDG